MQQTLADDPDFRLTDNVALAATASASFTEQPPMRLGAVDDGLRQDHRAAAARPVGQLPWHDVVAPVRLGAVRGTRPCGPAPWASSSP